MAREENVRQLSAALLIIFEMIEGVTDRSPEVASNLDEAMTETGIVINSLVVELYVNHDKLVPLVPLEKDVSYDPETEITDLSRLIEFYRSFIHTYTIGSDEIHPYLKSAQKHLERALEILILMKRREDTPSYDEKQNPWSLIESE